MTRKWYTLIEVRQTVVTLTDAEAASLDTRFVRMKLNEGSSSAHLAHRNDTGEAKQIDLDRLVSKLREDLNT